MYKNKIRTTVQGNCTTFFITFGGEEYKVMEVYYDPSEAQRITKLVYYGPVCDRHKHFRQYKTGNPNGDLMETAIHFATKGGSRWDMCEAMPNLSGKPESVEHAQALTTWSRVRKYKETLYGVAEKYNTKIDFDVVLYLTPETDTTDLVAGFKAGDISGVKIYPLGGTTHSHLGFADILDKKHAPLFSPIVSAGIPILKHGEQIMFNGQMTSPNKSERVFCNKKLSPFMEEYKEAIVSVEHISTIEMANFLVEYGGDRYPHLSGTITPQHLLYDIRDWVTRGGLQSDFFCWPTIKEIEDLARLQMAVFEAREGVIVAGTDSAPWLYHDKHKHGCCAGIFSDPVALLMYIGFFLEVNRPEMLISFLSTGYLRFFNHDWTSPEKPKVIVRKEQTIPEVVEYTTSDGVKQQLTPLHFNKKLQWSFEE